MESYDTYVPDASTQKGNLLYRDVYRNAINWSQTCEASGTEPTRQSAYEAIVSLPSTYQSAGLYYTAKNPLLITILSSLMVLFSLTYQAERANYPKARWSMSHVLIIIASTTAIILLSLQFSDCNSAISQVDSTSAALDTINQIPDCTTTSEVPTFDITDKVDATKTQKSDLG